MGRKPLVLFSDNYEAVKNSMNLQDIVFNLQP